MSTNKVLITDYRQTSEILQVQFQTTEIKEISQQSESMNILVSQCK